MTEAFSRVKIDQQLRDVGWPIDDGRSVRFEYTIRPDLRVDYVLCNRRGEALAVLEAKRSSVSFAEGEGQAVEYAEAMGLPFVFMANGEEVRFRDLDHDAHFRPVDTLFSQEDLERRASVRTTRRDPGTVPIDTRIAGRGYQRDCIDTLTREVGLGRRKLLVEMATGTGKTRTAAALIKRFFDASAITRVLFLVDRNTLAKQTEDAFAEHLPSLATYRATGSGDRFKPEKQITICTLQTMINDYSRYSSGYFDLIVIDECHRSIYGRFRRALDHFDGVKLGLTATPLVGTPPDADDEEQAFVRDTLRFFELERPTFRYTITEAIDEGFLVPYRIYRAQTVKTAAAAGFEVHRSEIDCDALDPTTRAELEDLFAEQDPIVVEPSALERRFTIPERNRAMAREFRDVLEHGYTGGDGVRRAPDWGKTIVFAVNKRHAETLAKMLDDTFADKKPEATTAYADYVVSGEGERDTPDAPQKIERFKKEPFPQILVSVNMLDTGFDYPEVVNLVMARFTRSGVLYRQMRGRGSRRADHIKKAAFTIFDFVGNCDAHQDEDPLDGGAVVTPKPAPPPPTPRRLLTLDVHDEIDPTTREWITYDATGTPHMASADEVRAEALGVKFEAFLAGEDLTAEQERFARQIGEQVKAHASDMASFELWRLNRPPFGLQGGLARARAMFGGKAELDAFLARLNAAVFDEGEEGGQTEVRPN